MVETGADRAYARLDHAPRGWWIVGGIGLAVAVATVVWWPHLVLYLVAVGLAALAAVAVALISLKGRRRALALLGIAVLTAASVVVPWRMAAAEQSGTPHWTYATDGLADNLFADGGRLLLSDDGGLHAVALADGSELWSYSDLSRIGTFAVSTDGYVLARSDTSTGEEFAWISPEGTPLWTHMDGSAGALEQVNLREPLAAAGGVLVARTCGQDLGDQQCTYVGVGPDGQVQWEIDGYRGVQAITARQDAEAYSYGEPQRMPQAIVIDSAEDEGGVAIVVDVTGETVSEIEVDGEGSVTVSGDVVVYDSAPASEGRCQSHGLSVDGAVDWSAETPCLHRSGVALGGWVYGVFDDEPGLSDAGGDPEDSFAIDVTTGSWHNVGGLALFNNDVDGIVGVPGADVVVQRQNQHLTGVDPGTGEVLWELEAPGERIPGVYPSHAGVVVLADPDPGHNPFFAGDARRGGMTALAVDAATGEIDGRMTREGEIWNTFAVGPGRVVLVDRDQVALIGSPPA